MHTAMPAVGFEDLAGTTVVAPLVLVGEASATAVGAHGDGDPLK